MDITKFTKMLKSIISVGWFHYDTDITTELMKKSENPKLVRGFYNRCKLVSYHSHIDLHDAVYHQLRRGQF